MRFMIVSYLASMEEETTGLSTRFMTNVPCTYCRDQICNESTLVCTKTTLNFDIVEDTLANWYLEQISLEAERHPYIPLMKSKWNHDGRLSPKGPLISHRPISTS